METKTNYMSKRNWLNMYTYVPQLDNIDGSRG